MDNAQHGDGLSRRRFLGAAGAATAALAVGPQLASAAGRTAAGATSAPAPSRRGGGAHGLSSIEHVVVWMQENRSFDHYFGSLAGVRGFDDPHAQRLPSGLDVFHQPGGTSPDGYRLPFRLDTVGAGGAAIADVPHDFSSGVAALDGGRNDAWVASKGEYALSYYTRADMPYYYALADRFTICDAYHCSVLGPTNPNRLYLMTGTVDGDGRFEGPILDNDESVPFTWTTYPERLEAAGVSWKVYQAPDNFDDNALAWFARFQAARPGSPLHDRGMAVSGLDAFIRDVRDDRLPKVSWLVAPAVFSEHPGVGSPAPGFATTARLLDALAANPRVWRKTAFILTYDENGGFFDHVLPPLPAPGTPGEHARDGRPIGLGIRVPTIVVSPWSRGGRIVSRTYDHTSILRLLEQRFGVEEPNISAFRRATCGDLTETLDIEGRPGSFPALPDVSRDVMQHLASWGLHPPVTPPAVQTVPRQERSRRHG